MVLIIKQQHRGLKK